METIDSVVNSKFALSILLLTLAIYLLKILYFDYVQEKKKNRALERALVRMYVSLSILYLHEKRREVSLPTFDEYLNMDVKFDPAAIYKRDRQTVNDRDQQ